MISKSLKETEKIAKVFLHKLLKTQKGPGALVVGLSGELGAGKTAFTKLAAKLLGIKDKISSPTFVIQKKYSLKRKGYKYFFHLDAYRLKNKKELLHLGWDELIGGQEHLIFIEWPENVAGALPPGSKIIYITTDQRGHRNFKLK